jgi:hypothetical protein
MNIKTITVLSLALNVLGLMLIPHSPALAIVCMLGGMALAIRNLASKS